MAKSKVTQKRHAPVSKIPLTKHGTVGSVGGKGSSSSSGGK